MSPLAIVTGVGPGTGSAIVRRLHEGGYRVAMLARTGARLEALAAELPNVIALPCDVADPVALAAVLDDAETQAGAPPRVIVHNAVGGAFGSFLEIEPATLERNFQVNVMALLHLSRWAAPRMEAAGGGALVITGNTSALRGKPRFAGFAPTKAAQRILAESIAREIGPRGVHVAYLVIDAVIDLAWTRALHPDRPDSDFIRPADIAEEVYRLLHQPPSAWSFLAEIRPFGETW